MLVCLDIDGVCADTMPLMLEVLNEAFGRRISPADCTAYDLKVLYGPAADAVLEQHYADIFRTAPPVAGAVEAVSRLAREAEILYLTARHTAHHEVTASWLWRHRFPHGQVVHTPAKWYVASIHGAAAVVEDSPQHALECAGRLPVVLLDYPYNRDVSGPDILRARDWEEAERLVRACLARAA